MRTSNQYFDNLNGRRRQILALLSGKLIFFIGAGGEEVCIKTPRGFKVFENLNPTYQFNQLYRKHASQRSMPTRGPTVDYLLQQLTSFVPSTNVKSNEYRHIAHASTQVSLKEICLKKYLPHVQSKVTKLFPQPI
jgi:hypothetical protein